MALKDANEEVVKLIDEKQEAEEKLKAFKRHWIIKRSSYCLMFNWLKMKLSVRG